MGASITDFFDGTTKEFDVDILYRGVAPDITNDRVRFVGYQGKTKVIDEDADVTTYGSEGKAVFTIDKANTDVDVGKLDYEVIWYITSGGKEYVLEQESIAVKEKFTASP